jgi:large subunit ribosomal protein L23
MSSEKILDILRNSHVSEKSARLQAASNQYVFEVASTATKADVKAAVEALLEAKVASVNILNVKGKRKTFRFRAGRRGGLRKAYVTLAEGQSIDLMAKP